MAPRPSTGPRPPPTGPEPEVICPLATRDGKICRKKCVGDKRFRSMQEHIRRAHTEYYIPKLPASEESFHRMINTPPKEDPDPAPSAPEPHAPLTMPRTDVPDGLIAHEIQSAPAAPFENALFESFMDDIDPTHGSPEAAAALLLPDALMNQSIPEAPPRLSIDFASAPALDSDPLSAITSEYHASVAQPSGANSFSQDRSLATLPPPLSMPVSIWDDDLQPLPGEDAVTVCTHETATIEIMNGTYPFFDGDCSMFPHPELAEHKPPPSGRLPNELTGGLDPEIRPTTEVPSINALHHQRAVEARNDMVHEWLYETIGIVMLDPGLAVDKPADATDEKDDGVPVGEVTLGSGTENIAQPGQIYYLEEASGFKDPEDLNIMNLGRHWHDAPVRLGISRANCPRTQPATSSAAIAQFSKMCEESADDAALSVAASCGTRRASLPPMYDVEGSTAGHFLCKMAVPVRGERPRGGLLATTMMPCVDQATLKRKHCDRKEEGLDCPKALFGQVAEEAVYRAQGKAVVDRRGDKRNTALPTPESEKQPSEELSTEPPTTAAGGSVALGSPPTDSPTTPPSLAPLLCCPLVKAVGNDAVEGTGWDYEAKHELARADGILGSVLARNDIPRELQEQLAQVSGILTTVQSKLS